MGYLDVILIALGLSMDAVAVSMANGMSAKPDWKKALVIAAAFGLFQGIMPLASYYAGTILADFIKKITHWLALILLSVIGAKMILDGFNKNKDAVPTLTFKLLLLQSVGVSIDAFAVGVSFVGIKFNIFAAVGIIALTTAVLSYIGVFLGKLFGDLLSGKAQIIGGVILIGIGLKIFIENVI